MIRFRSIATLLVLAALAVCAYSQGTTGGLLYASDFANWGLPQGNTPMQGTVFYPNPDICKVTSNGYTFLAAKVGRPLTIVDGANTETFTPTAVSITTGVCMISGTMAHSHSSYSIKSGTAGAQEAIDYQASQPQGANIVLTPTWTAAGGSTGVVTGTLKGNTGVTILDQRTAALTAYTWNGSAYTPNPFAVIAGGAGVGNCAQIGAGNTITSTGAPCSTGGGTVNSGQLSLAQYPTSAATAVSPGNFTYDAATGNNLTIGTSGAGKSYLGSSIASGAPMADIRHPSFSGGAVCDNATDIGPALQAAVNALPLKGGKILVPGSPTACYWANPTAFNWPTFTGTVSLQVQGQLRTGSTLYLPYYITVNIMGASGQSLASFQGSGEGSLITLSPLSGACGGTLGSTIITTPSRPDGSVETGTWGSGSTAVTLADSQGTGSLVGSVATGSGIPVGDVVTANTGTSVTLTSPTTGAATARNIVFQSVFTPSTTACLFGASSPSNVIQIGSLDNSVNVNFPSGSVITVGGPTTCTVTGTTTRASNFVTATFTGACHIPIGSPVTVAGMVDGTFNGAYNPGASNPHPFEVLSQDYVKNTLTWRNTGTNGTTTGGTVSGFNEDTLETTYVSAVSGGNVTAPFFRTHSSSDVWGVVAVANYGGVDTLRDFQIADPWGTALYVKSGAFASNIERVGVSTNNFSLFNTYSNWPLEIDDASFINIKNSSFLNANSAPWSIRITQPYNKAGSAPGSIWITDRTWVGEGIKLDHGASALYLSDVIFQGGTRGAITIDPTNYWNGNQQNVYIARSGMNDSPDSTAPCMVYYTTPTSTTAAQAVVHLDSFSSGTRNCAYSDYFSGFPLTNVPNGAGGAVAFNQTTAAGPIGTLNNGKFLEAEIRGSNAAMAPSLVPYATAPVITNPASWPAATCTVTTGTLAPDSTATAGTLTKASGVGSSNIYTWSGVPAVGDHIVFGGWVYNSGPGTGLPGGSSMLLDNGGASSAVFNFTSGTNVLNTQWESSIYDDWWHPVVAVGTVSVADGASHSVRFFLSCGDSNIMNFWQPFFSYIPASSNISLREINRWRQQDFHGYVPASGVGGQSYTSVPINLPADPTTALQAAPRQYVESQRPLQSLSSAGSTSVDNFVRASGVLGANWNTATSNLQITSSGSVGNTSTTTTNPNQYTTYAGSLFTPDQCSQATITALPQSTNLFQLSVRMTTLTTAGQNGYVALASNPSGSTVTYQIYKVVAGSFTLLQTTTVSDQLAVGDTLKFCDVGTTLTMYRNGTQVLQDATGNTQFATGLPGFGFASSNPANTGRFGSWIGTSTGVAVPAFSNTAIAASTPVIATDAKQMQVAGTTTGTGSTVVLSASPALTGTPTIGGLNATTSVVSGTSAMGTGAITAGTCATVVTTAATGAATTDSIGWAFNAAPGTGYTAGLHVLAYPTSGNVNFLVCNPTAGSLTPAAATLNWRIAR